MMITLFVGRMYRFEYNNYAGKTEQRHIRFESMSFGASPHHQQPQWFMNGHCLIRNARRTFALNDIVSTTLREDNPGNNWPKAWESFEQYQDRKGKE